ncbi:MAG: methylisocitrate lyase [Armatimonadetes bacterium]|nr:methylisocitrate lyase [Armatimonadota bacterium]
MIHAPLHAPGAQLRKLFEDEIVVMPGAFSAMTALAAYKAGAKAVYLSGGAMTNNQLGVPDIGLMTLTEMSSIAAQACQVAPVPIISDADTGFGAEWNAVRSVIEFERAGLAGIHIEDQVSPKRCGHLDGKAVVAREWMCSKIRAAVSAKKDSSFMILARTDAAAIEGVPVAIDRAKAYVDAGADGVFPEGLASEEEFEAFRAGLPGVPLLANMTEFGKTPLIPAARFGEMGYQMVIFPVSALRVMLKSVGSFYEDLLKTGTQEGWIERMATRDELYELIDYEEYTAMGKEWSGE